MSDYKFIAGAVCPACGYMDSIKLKNDDSEIKCISCNYSKQKDAQFVTKHYWGLYLSNWIVFALISKWLVVWLAFMFSWSWVVTAR